MGVTADTQGGTENEEGLEDRMRTGLPDIWAAWERTKAAREQRERAGNEGERTKAAREQGSTPGMRGNGQVSN